MTGQTRVNGTKALSVPILGAVTPIRIGGMPTEAQPGTAPVLAEEPRPDLVAEAEAARIRALAYAETEAARVRAEAEAGAIRIKAEEEGRRLRLANDKAERRAREEDAASAARIAETNRKRAESERLRQAAQAAEKASRDAEKASRDAEVEQAKEIATADDKWRKYAIRFAFVCGIVSLPVQMSFFWNPRAPWMAAAPIMLEGAAWVVHRGARAAVANRCPVWHYRLIVWLLAFAAAGINLYHGLHSFDPGTALATAFASVAGPGVWDLHEHGRIRKRDGKLSRGERRAQERAEKRTAAEKAARDTQQRADRGAAEKAARDAVEKLSKEREQRFPKVWEHAQKLAAALGEISVTETVWRRAHKDVEGTDPGDSAEAQQFRNAAARRMFDARADAPDKNVWKITDAQVNPQVPPTRRRGSVTGPPVRGVRRPGDTAPFVEAACKQAAITAKNAVSDTSRKDA